MSTALSKLGSWTGTGGHRTLAEKAFTVLHEAILTGQLKAGERLPIEDLADLLGMSPMPIREAVRRLDAAGLVENIPHRGARVTQLSIDDLRDVYESRLALEPLAVRRAAECFTEEDAERAAERLDALARLARKDTPEAWAAHTAFHFALYEAADSRWLVRLIRPLWESSERYRLSSAVKRDLGSREQEHEQILAACVAHDAERADHALRRHLEVTANAVSRSMGGGVLFDEDRHGVNA